MKKLITAKILLLALFNVHASDIAYVDCYVIPEKEGAKKFIFLELDWDKASGKADASYFQADGTSIGEYSNFDVVESPKQIVFQTPLNLLKDTPTQYVEVIVSRHNLNFSAGITTPQFKQVIGANLLNLKGECAVNNERAKLQAF